MPQVLRSGSIQRTEWKRSIGAGAPFYTVAVKLIENHESSNAKETVECR
jgi:hypothetical protein